MDELISIAAHRGNCTRSKVVNDLVREKFKGAKVCWPGDPDGQDDPVATDPRAKIAG